MMRAGRNQERPAKCRPLPFATPSIGRSVDPESGADYLKRAIQFANNAPEMLCQTLKIALGTAARGEK